MKTQQKFISSRTGLTQVLALVSLAFLVLLLSSSSMKAARSRSLWISPRNSEMGMVSDKRAVRKGDPLTVIIDEKTSMSTSQRTKSDKTADIDDQINQLIYPDVARRNGQLPAIDVSGNNTYEGGGEITNSQKMGTEVTVRVTDVLPNGSLVIAGVRKIAFSNETHYVLVEGFAWPRDITEDNTIRSSKLADARIEMVSEGELSDAQKQGWLLKINNMLNPF